LQKYEKNQTKQAVFFGKNQTKQLQFFGKNQTGNLFSNFRIIVVYFSWHEKTLDTVEISDADLYVVFIAESGIGVQFFAFGEDAADGIEGRLMRLFFQSVQSFNNRTVPITEQEVAYATNGFAFRKIGII